MNKNLIIGIGTGRCGTKSIAHILSVCSGVNVTHERSSFRFNFISNHYREEAEKIVNGLLFENDNFFLNGDVAHYHLRRIPDIVSIFPNVKIIHIFRDKSETTDSWLRKCGGLSNCREEDYQLIVNRRGNSYANVWYNTFPTFSGTVNSKEAWDIYWDFYEKDVLLLKRKGINIYSLNVNDLNNDNKLFDLFTYLEIPEDRMIFPAARVFNKSL